MPRRRCVGCGRIAPKTELLRIVATDRGSAGGDRPGPTRAIVDPHAIMSGRGAYLCRAGDVAQPDERCLALATRRGGIARALRRPIAGGLLPNDAKLVESVSR